MEGVILTVETMYRSRLTAFETRGRGIEGELGVVGIYLASVWLHGRSPTISPRFASSMWTRRL